MKINEILTESTKTKLSQLCTIKTNYPDADFWIIRRGSEDKVGKPTHEFNPEHIGLKVNRLDILVPDYLYYVIEYLHMRGYFKLLSHGSTRLVNIKASDIRDISLDTEADSVKNFQYRDFKYKMNEPRFKK